MGLERPLPETNGLADTFWKAAGEETLLIQKCRTCQHHQHYARPLCLRCESSDLEMVPASGTGVVASYTVIHRSPYTDITTPYVLALIRLEEDVTMLSHIVETDPSSITCDMRVAVKFAPLRDGVKLPVFVPASEV